MGIKHHGYRARILTKGILVLEREGQGISSSLFATTSQRGVTPVREEKVTYPFPPWQAHCWPLGRYHHHKAQDCRKANQQSPQMHGGNTERSWTREGTVAKEAYAKYEPTISCLIHSVKYPSVSLAPGKAPLEIRGN